MRNLSLFDDAKTSLDNSLELTAQSLEHYGSFYKHWVIAFSGGKDSSAVLTSVLYLIETGRIQKPESLTILYADTRQELPPLHESAMGLLKDAEKRGALVKVVTAELDKRFWVYILGRGVPSPNNGTLRWCTRQIKVEPMTNALAELRSTLEPNERLLMLTGVRVGESTQRDQRISASCTKDGGECGQGWFQSMTAPQTDTLAPILHWRLCHVWDWLMEADLKCNFPTSLVAHAYGLAVSDGEEPLNARTGCIGCPLVERDDALDRLIGISEWQYLAPLKRIKSIHREIRLKQNRLRKSGEERKKNGSLVKNPGRVGPITLEARERFLNQVLAIQDEINQNAIECNRPQINLINPEEETRIRELIALKTFPDRWSGDEQNGATLLPEIYQDGSIQALLFHF